MNFEQRNEKWQGAERTFVQVTTRSSAPRIWQCKVEGSVVKTRWGQQGSENIQDASETANGVNKGKKNEISPEDYALYLGREKCRKKHWEGYREVDGSWKPLDELVTEIDFDNPPLNLSFWKPDNSPGPGITKKAENRAVWYTRKMNGIMFPVWRGAGDPFLTSRRMLRQNDNEQGSEFTWDHRFPHIIQALRDVLPPRSCLLGELVAFDKKNQDSLALIGSYTKSLTPKALELQAQQGWAYYYVWDIAFWDGIPLVKEAPVRERYELITKTFHLPGVCPVQILTPDMEAYGPVDVMKERAKEWGFEGFVMVDPDGVFGDRAYNFKGKPDRPGKFAAKVKPEYEDDFIVFWDPEKGYGEFSTKDRYGKGMKSACLYQLNEKGELVYIANVASGLTEEMKTNAKPSQFPQVWKVIYTDRRYISDGDDTNAIDFPRYDSTRTDKKIPECVNPRL